MRTYLSTEWQKNDLGVVKMSADVELCVVRLLVLCGCWWTWFSAIGGDGQKKGHRSVSAICVSGMVQKGTNS